MTTERQLTPPDALADLIFSLVLDSEAELVRLRPMLGFRGKKRRSWMLFVHCSV